ncbi:aldehyde dehydrogenase family protein [Streptomyces niveus]|uniref:aldehyde dehydrogenase family protein n=1 Tax=Streptomyces niveus TaxID=193462 RepID=UPI00365E3B07
MTGSRVLVQRGVADELRRRLVASLETVRVGPGDDPASEMGAMIDESNAQRVEQTVAAAADYATALVRGKRDRAFLGPSLIEVRDVSAPIVQREVFGPVATFEIFDSEADAVARANATEFGLAASIWTRDVDRPLRVGRELRAGTVWTNTRASCMWHHSSDGSRQKDEKR